MVAPVSMRQVAVIGAADCTDEEYTAAERVGGLLADHHAILFCGGLGGVMEASVKGRRSRRYSRGDYLRNIGREPPCRNCNQDWDGACKEYHTCPVR